MSEKILENSIILTGKELEPVEGYMRVRDGVIEEVGEGNPPSPGEDLKESYIVPPFVNAHTHLGDSVRKDFYGGKSQPQVVGPGGRKFEILSDASEGEIIEAMRDSLLEMKKSGVQAHFDFRENGSKGVKLLREAEVEGIDSIILSRPTPEESIEELISISDGIGLPSLDSATGEEIGKISREISKRGKFLSFHVSETEKAHEKSLEETGKTEIQRALEFDPSYLVHGTFSTEEDLASISDRGVPLVLCPRANSLLGGGIPPIKQALEEGVELWLGTDNAFLCQPIILQELSFAWSVLRLRSEDAGSQEARELLKAATVNPADDLDLPFGPLEEGSEAKFTVLSRGRNLRRCEDPYIGIVNRATTENVDRIFF